MDNDVTPYWGGEIIDEEDLSSEERAQLPWNDPADFPSERPYHIEESPMGLWIVEEEDWDSEEEDESAHGEEEPDINLMYGLYEESEFY